ncbi:MAG TPA: DUF1801 domain-containing protein [Jiangellaceae bacterium]
MGRDVSTVQEYLDNLEPDRREVVSAVREVVNAAMPDGYEEGIAYGMIGWSVPLERYPDTYNGQPLGYVALAAQKRYYSLYLNALYAGSVDETEFRRRWEDSGRKLDMGKSCLRFRKLEDLNLDLIAETVAGTPVDAYIARYEQARAR